MVTAEILSTEAADVLLQLRGRPSWLYQQEILSRSMTVEITLFCMQYWTVYWHTQGWHISPCLSSDTEQERHLQIALESSRFKEKKTLKCLHLTFPGRQDFPQEERNHPLRDHTLPTNDEGNLDMGSGTDIWMAIVSPGNDAPLSPGAMHQKRKLKVWEKLREVLGKLRKVVMSAFLLFKTLRNHWFHLNNKGNPAFEFLKKCPSDETCRKPGESQNCYSKQISRQKVWPVNTYMQKRCCLI